MSANDNKNPLKQCKYEISGILINLVNYISASFKHIFRMCLMTACE